MKMAITADYPLMQLYINTKSLKIKIICWFLAVYTVILVRVCWIWIFTAFSGDSSVDNLNWSLWNVQQEALSGCL